MPCLLAVGQDATGNAHEIGLSYSSAIGGGKAGFGKGDFYAEPAPTIKLHQPSRYRHLNKVLFEKYWMWKWF